MKGDGGGKKNGRRKGLEIEKDGGIQRCSAQHHFIIPYQSGDGDMGCLCRFASFRDFFKLITQFFK